MKQPSNSKYGQLQSLKYPKQIPNYPKPKKPIQIRPNFLRYKDTDGNSDHESDPNQQIITQNSEKTAEKSFKKMKQAQLSHSIGDPDIFLKEKQKMMSILRQKEVKNQSNAYRKNSPPQKISNINDYISAASNSSPPIKKNKLPRKQFQTNKKLIQKLLSVRHTVKVVSQSRMPRNTTQYPSQNSKSSIELKIKRGLSEKAESPQKRVNFNLIAENLKFQLIQANMEENQFNLILKKKKLHDFQNSRPYSNNQIYSKIRNDYKKAIQQAKCGPIILDHFQINKIQRSQTKKVGSQDYQLKKKAKIDANMLEKRKKLISQQQLRYRELPVEGW